MDIATRKKLGVERQTTFGPSAPIDEWELEKATLLREAKENRERAERLQQKLEQDQLAYERNTSSLLKEVKLKETSWEKRRQETDENWMNQILELQRQLDLERREYEDTIKDTKLQMEHSLQAEQQKYDRRMTNLHSRLEAKEKALQQYLSTMTTTVNIQGPSNHTPPSPITPSTPSNYKGQIPSTLTTNTEVNPTNIMHDQRQQLQQLQQQLIKQRRRNDVLEQQLKTSSHHALTETIDPLPSSFSDIDRKQLEEMHKKKIQGLIDTHIQEQQRLRDNFMNENSGLTLHMEARLQNAQNEYENALQESRDQFAAEKKVWEIEQQAIIDQLRRQLEQQYFDEQKKEERRWRNKLEDMEASLSKDALEIQTHWQTRINTLVDGHDKEILRLRGELDVVKSRLGKDIDRRHQIQAYLSTIELDHKKDRQVWIKKNQQFEQIVKKLSDENEIAKTLSVTLLSTLSMDDQVDLCELPSSSLNDLLKLVMRKVTMLQVKKPMTDYDVYTDAMDDIPFNSYLFP